MADALENSIAPASLLLKESLVDQIRACEAEKHVRCAINRDTNISRALASNIGCCSPPIPRMILCRLCVVKRVVWIQILSSKHDVSPTGMFEANEMYGVEWNPLQSPRSQSLSR